MIVIHHNPECGTSRNVLSVIQQAGYEPVIIDYQQQGWTKPQLLGLFAAAELTPKTALRVTKSPAKELGLLEDNVSDEQILAAMLQYPILVNRPIVCTPKGVKLCRPSEAVLDLLDKWPKGPFSKEDGELIIDSHNQRVST
ncbi:arsenate reductase family protein [Shewanella fidelis]|uniref:Arsenate reductase n=1 Tax=Shewanella fidelis TaxID=173509 RepID=A0AAW8NG13_9GAMM|nr:arsenate reductase family protein [Shewanella fidelis]MDR8522257.1 arsenate reductase family protein [Shewanella fidelis]MDW4812527.1 arsenate reductase family protein [Shewanella fidelis]MDW4816274.1 arsenate reductase family protein [Shewanella fidelis]MDW4820768.1 arsenate reductase family protein [Shewanella fidelis]MDW4824990.1 arsenate reductase family protein [Shewanella fidelis]